MKCLISIIIPIYNVEKHLEKCINSIINQTYKDLEIILIDDGSPDRCGQICDEYIKIDKRIKVIHKPNGGLSEARNYGMKEATGDYITFIDSDDYISEFYCEKLLSLIKEHDADISVGNYCYVHEDKDVELKHENIETAVYTGLEALELIYSPLNVQMIISCAKLYKKEVIDNIEFPVGKINEDEFTTYKFLYNSKKVVVTNEELYFYLQRNGSITKTKLTKKNLDVISGFSERKAFFEAKGLLTLSLKAEVCMFDLIIVFIMKVHNSDMRKEEKKYHEKYLLKLLRENRSNLLRNEYVSFKKKLSLFGMGISPGLMKKYYEMRNRSHGEQEIIY